MKSLDLSLVSYDEEIIFLGLITLCRTLNVGRCMTMLACPLVLHFCWQTVSLFGQQDVAFYFCQYSDTVCYFLLKIQ